MCPGLCKPPTPTPAPLPQALPVQNDQAKKWLQSGGSVEVPYDCIEGGWGIYKHYTEEGSLKVGDIVFCALQACERQPRYCADRITCIDWIWLNGRLAQRFRIADSWCYEPDIYGIQCTTGAPK